MGKPEELNIQAADFTPQEGEGLREFMIRMVGRQLSALEIEETMADPIIAVTLKAVVGSETTEEALAEMQRWADDVRIEAAEQRYRRYGFEAIHAVDPPNKVYEPHSHHETYLYGVSGLARIKIEDDDWQDIEKGQEIYIGEGQLHEAVIGPNGWEYVFAYPEGVEPYSHEPPQE